MIILICGNFPILSPQGWNTGRTEFLVSHGVERDSLKTIVLPNEHPRDLGATFNTTIGEWILE